MLVSNILPDPQTLNAIQGEHEASLVLVSWLVALAASYAGLDIIKLVSNMSRPMWRRVWLWAGASAMGLGVWSMHFIGMQAAWFVPDPSAAPSSLSSASQWLISVIGGVAVLTVWGKTLAMSFCTN